MPPKNIKAPLLFRYNCRHRARRYARAARLARLWIDYAFAVGVNLYRAILTHLHAGAAPNATGFIDFIDHFLLLYFFVINSGSAIPTNIGKSR